MNDTLENGLPSTENKAHCEAFADGVFPKKAADVPVHQSFHHFKLILPYRG